MFKTKFSSSSAGFDTQVDTYKVLKGEDGFSPIVQVVETREGHRIAITDKTQTQIFDVQDGEQGPQGDRGPQGIPGTATRTRINPVTLYWEYALVQGAEEPKEDEWITSDIKAQGPQGIQGEQGLQGIQGNKGDKGDTGANGQDGVSVVYIDLIEVIEDSYTFTILRNWYVEDVGASNFILKINGIQQDVNVGTWTNVKTVEIACADGATTLYFVDVQGTFPTDHEYTRGGYTLTDNVIIGNIEK